MLLLSLLSCAEVSDLGPYDVALTMPIFRVENIDGMSADGACFLFRTRAEPRTFAFYWNVADPAPLIAGGLDRYSLDGAGVWYADGARWSEIQADDDSGIYVVWEYDYYEWTFKDRGDGTWGVTFESGGFYDLEEWIAEPCGWWP